MLSDSLLEQETRAKTRSLIFYKKGKLHWVNGPWDARTQSLTFLYKIKHYIYLAVFKSNPFLSYVISLLPKSSEITYQTKVICLAITGILKFNFNDVFLNLKYLKGKLFSLEEYITTWFIKLAIFIANYWAVTWITSLILSVIKSCRFYFLSIAGKEQLMTSISERTLIQAV